MMRDLLLDVRFGWRNLARRPGLTAVAALTLAIGIGATTTIFSLADALLLRPIVAHEPARLFDVHAKARDGSGFHAFSYLDYLDYRTGGVDGVAGLAAWSVAPVALGFGAEARLAMGQIVSESYFEVYGVAPALGRFFAPEEAGPPGAHPVAVLGHRTWQTELAGDPEAIGRTIRVNGHPFTVIGVAPPRFGGPVSVVATELWLPLAMQATIAPTENLDQRGSVWLEMVGRLAAGSTWEQALAALELRGRQIADATGREHWGLDLTAAGAVPGRGRDPLRAFMAVLAATVGLVLVIACVNVAGVLLGRAAQRRGEIAVRLAIGAGRARLVRLLLVETVLLFALGGGLGTLLALLALRALSAVELPLPIPLDLHAAIDLRVLGFALALTVATAILFGLVPALRASRLDLFATLGHQGLTPGVQRSRLRSAFVVAQVAVSALLLVAAGLFLRALATASAIDPGFDADGVAIATVDLALAGYDEAAAAAFFQAVQDRLDGRPGVAAAAWGRIVPLTMSNSVIGIEVPGHQPPAPAESFPVDVNDVGPGYFRALAMPLLAGRGFAAGDRAGAPQVAVVNRTLAERFWPPGEVLGRRFTDGDDDFEVIGVVADARVRTLGEAPRPMVYRPLAQSDRRRATLHVRGAAGVDPGVVAQTIRAAVRDIDPDLPLLEERSMASAVGISLLPQRVASAVTVALGAVGALLAGLGVYGVIAFAVAQRKRELGLRLALGAAGGDLLRLILRQGLALAGIGLALGLAGALALTRLLRGLLYGVSPADPAVLAATAALLAGVAGAASLVPALRAAAVDPNEALRHE